VRETDEAPFTTGPVLNVPLSEWKTNTEAFHIRYTDEGVLVLYPPHRRVD
jgi:hypothetical protein